MRQKSSPPETPSERLVRDIRRATRKQYSAEEKIRIVLDGLRGEVSIAELCRREGRPGLEDDIPARAVNNGHEFRLLRSRYASDPKLSLVRWLKPS